MKTPKEPETVKCIICKKILKCDTTMDCPLDGVVFDSHGNYGTEVFDPLEEKMHDSPIVTTLFGVVCDECLRKKANLFYQRKNQKEVVSWKTVEIKRFDKELKSRRIRGQI
jgi:hypothetical protein